ncbi:MAG: TROVE domain-containing protein [Clostridia bacterium]|nr:TROVE domain-containing protein [Clostridia bacterium]
MSKFNEKVTIVTQNNSGAPAYSMSVKARLVTEVLTSFFGEPKYYGDNTNQLIKDAMAVIDVDPRFVANLARYARKEMHLRSVSHALAALIAYRVESKPYIREVVDGVVERADDITEILSCYINMYGKPIPNGLKKALGAAMCRFNAYQFSKYNGGGKQLSFRDVLRLIHAKPANQEQNRLFNDIINDTLPIAERWETELSAKGNNTETWYKLIDEKKLGYMAALRNLRNILNAAPDNMDEVLDMIADANAAVKSKQLPFRFFSAYREISACPNAGSKVFRALEKAISASVQNLPKLAGTTVIAIDTSGSMTSRISRNSSVSCADIAKLIAVLSAQICDNAIVYIFDTEIKKLAVDGNGAILKTVSHIPSMGGGTDLTLPLKEMLNNKVLADRMILLSDNEINYGWGSGSFTVCCQSLADQYRREINPDLWIHAIDLQGYGTQQFVGKNTNIIAGWGERVIEFIALAEQGMETQVKRIQNYGVADSDASDAE